MMEIVHDRDLHIVYFQDLLLPFDDQVVKFVLIRFIMQSSLSRFLSFDSTETKYPQLKVPLSLPFT